MRKLSALFICLATLFAFGSVSFAEAEPAMQEGQFITSDNGNMLLADNLELLSEIEEDYVKDNMAEAIAEKAISVGVVSTETIEQETADFYYSNIGDEDFAVLLFNKDEYALYFYGNAETEYAEDDDAFWMTESYFDGDAYFAAALQFPLDIKYHTVTEYDYTETPEETTAVSSEFPENYFTEIANNGIHTASLENGHIALLHDLDDSLTTNEEAQVLTDLMNAVRDTDFNIGIVITDNIGDDKSDYGVMDFTDVYYEDYCGKDTDGVLLLINNDTKYDWFSASGRCINMFYGKEDDVLDSTYDYLVDGNYGLACQAFVQSVRYYGINANYDDDYYDNDGFDYSYDEDGHHLHIEANDLEGGFGLFFFAFFIAIIAVSIFAGSINSSYKMKKNVSAANYKLANSLAFSQSTDTFLRTYTTRRRVSSSSSSGSRSRSSGGSRSHRSSGGGRHGGGGRRR